MQAKLMPPGGINSLLYHMAASLEDVIAVLSAMGKSPSPWKRASQWLYPVATLALISLIHSRRIRTAGVNWRLRSTLSIGLLSVLLYRRIVLANGYADQLANIHRQLQLLTRLWVLILDQFTTTNTMSSRSKSYALNIADLRDGSHLHANAADSIPVRRMLMNTSLPSDAAIWCTKNVQLYVLKRSLDLVYASVADAYPLRNSSWSALFWPATLASGLYYILRPDVAAERAASTLQNCHVEFVSYVWNLVNSPGLLAVTSLVADPLATDRDVPLPSGGHLTVLSTHAVPPEWWDFQLPQSLVPDLLASDECELAPSDVNPHANHAQSSTLRSSSTAQKSRVLLDGEVEEFYLEASCSVEATKDPARCTFEPFPSPTSDSTVLLYVHGGGFVASSYSVDRLRIAKWASSAGFSVAYMHYTLSPEARHPAAVNQCVEAYCWLRARFASVVVFGDSAGGNLVAALTVRCIASGLPVPEALTMAFPALNLNEAPGPSRALHLNDPLVPVGLLTTVADAYFPRPLRGVPHENPYISPSFATDDVLRHFPPTFVVVGGLDPLLDDSIDFVTRLRRLGVPGSMKVYRSLPHGFFSFDFLPMADQAINDVKMWVQSDFSLTKTKGGSATALGEHEQNGP